LFPTFQLFLVPLLLVGFAGVLFTSAPEAPDFVLPHMILETGMPAIIVGLFCAGALAASMSTGDALLHGAASITIEDGIRPFFDVGDRQSRLLMRVLVIAVGAAAFWLAVIQRRSLVLLLLGAYGFVNQLAPPIVAALYWRRATTSGVLAGLIAGVASMLYFVRNPAAKPFEIHEGILGLVVNVTILVIVSLATRKQGDAHLDAFTIGPTDAEEAAASHAPPVPVR
jgi:SSS family solute:Na+ symporter